MHTLVPLESEGAETSPPRPGVPRIAEDAETMAHLQCTLILGLLVVLPTAAWMQHVYSCLVSGSWGFLIGGTLFLPAGLAHGVGSWLGLWG